MGRNLSPVVCRELENLDKGADSRKNAMKALKSYVKDLDSKAIPLFLAQVSATKDQGCCSGEYTISLFEVLARVHGRNIVPQIEHIMSTILKTLSTSAGSFPLHQACSKVVPAIARYGIEPMTPHDEKNRIIMSLCKPLADALMGSPESLASGAALCLKSLVESDNWRFASSDMVNDLCLKVAGALEEKSTQTNAHMGLAMSLSKHNSMTAEAYARSLLRSGLKILAIGTEEGNSQKRFCAIQMINFLMKCVDSRSISSELANVADVMENCQADPMPYIKGAAFEALQTAKSISLRMGSRYEMPYVGSNFTRGYIERDLGDSPPSLLSPESQTMDSFTEHDSPANSPLSSGQLSCNLGPGKRASRRLWSSKEGSVDVSLKDGLFSGSTSGSNGLRSYIEQLDGADRDDTAREGLGLFSGFANGSTMENKHDYSPSPRRPRSPISIHDPSIFSTPRRLVRSLQDETDENTECCDGHEGRVPLSPSSPLSFELNPITETDEILNYSCNFGHNKDGDMKHGSGGGNQTADYSGSVSSGCDRANEFREVACESCGTGRSSGSQGSRSLKSRCGKAAVGLVMSLCLALPAIVVSFMWMDDGRSCLEMVPT